MDNENVVVVTANGFLTTKNKKEVLSTDERVFVGTRNECQNVIHGKKVTK